MAAVTVSGMLAAEAAALANGWTEEQLLTLAGQRLGRAIGRFFPLAGTAVGYLGKGHNAGDTLVALKVLRDEFHWKVAARNAFPFAVCAPLFQNKWRELGLHRPLSEQPNWQDSEGPLLLLDGLLGTGSQGALKAPLLGLAKEMKWLRDHAGARIAAVDLPSGIDADTGVVFPDSVTADITFMIGNAKQGLLDSRACSATGALALVPVEALSHEGSTGSALIAPQCMAFSKAHRPFDTHKGQAGRIGILAGSERYTGAAVLAALGALRGGGGLITLYVPYEVAPVVASKCPPEVIVRGIASLRELEIQQQDAWVIGCGIGELNPLSIGDLIRLIESVKCPTVIDADALNLIARSGAGRILSEHHIITPHPGEFGRLAPDLSAISRESAARQFADRTRCTLLLKGARSIITRKGQPLWCNATGSPGMATGGQGDLLAGVIGACLAAGSAPLEATALSAWVCGRAAEIALLEAGISEESLTPTDVARYLGQAFNDWRGSRR